MMESASRSSTVAVSSIIWFRNDTFTDGHGDSLDQGKLLLRSSTNNIIADSIQRASFMGDEQLVIGGTNTYIEILRCLEARSVFSINERYRGRNWDMLRQLAVHECRDF